MMDFDKIAFGNRLRIARKQKELKQIEVCFKLGVNQPSYSGYENGKIDITVSTLFQLSSILDVSVLWLLGIDNNINSFSTNELLQIENFKQYIKSIRNKK